jgi:hypothetical protein
MMEFGNLLQLRTTPKVQIASGKAGFDFVEQRGRTAEEIEGGPRKGERGKVGYGGILEHTYSHGTLLVLVLTAILAYQ